ncbi:hypothetical protein CYG49_02350 [Candidatus Saccharibacteria bacterium]|nr:MAG: hypothetical protein CYG49_02350 [Candidatus Saccharibacteria bacterium]
MIYLVVMALVVFFVPPVAVHFLAAQLGIKGVTLASYRWLAAAVVVLLAAIAIYFSNENMTTNFVLHAAGGGVVSSLLYAYGVRSLQVRLPLAIDLLALFALVSMLGVLNELAEFALDLLGYGPKSLDRMDTWRDFVANTTGALIGWALIRLFVKDEKPRSIFGRLGRLFSR